MSLRIRAIQIREAKAKVERNLKLAEDHPKFEDKFLNQAIKADELVQRLEDQR